MPTQRILMVAPAPFDFDRGKSLRVRQSVEHLVRLGYELDVLTYPTGRDIDQSGVRTYRTSSMFKTNPSVPGFTWKSLLSDAALVKMAVKSLRTERYAAIHAHDIDGVLIALMARRLVEGFVPVVYDMHGAFSELADHYELPLPDFFIDYLEQLAYDRSQHIILNWPHLRELVASETPTSLILDKPAEEIQIALARSTSVDEVWGDSPFILYTGNYAPYQGVGLLLDAFARLWADHEFGGDKPQLVLTGEPPDEYLVDHEAIHYIGFVEEPRLAALLRHADVLVSPRLTEGFPPMKINYYLLTDNPIVVTDKTCHTSVLTGYDGVFFTDPAPADMAAGLVTALETDRSIHRTPPFDNYAQKYRSIYDSLCVR